MQIVNVRICPKCDAFHAIEDFDNEGWHTIESPCGYSWTDRSHLPDDPGKLGPKPKKQVSALKDPEKFDRLYKLGRACAAERKARGLTLREVGAQIGASDSEVQKCEYGKGGASLTGRIAAWLGVTVDNA